MNKYQNILRKLNLESIGETINFSKESKSKLIRTMARLQSRERLTKKYAWAVPNATAIEALVEYSPIVEIGAGAGYWAKLVKDAGGAIMPYDIDITYKGYVNVLEGGPEVLQRYHAGFNLFLCWPPLDDVMAYAALNYFNGQFVIYVGEGAHGCTGSEEFHDKLDYEYSLIEEIEIPQWWGIHDRMFIYERIKEKEGDESWHIQC